MDQVAEKTRFKNVCRVLQRIPNINYGGCGIAALTMLRAIKHKRADVEIVCNYSWSEIYDRNCKRSLEKQPLEAPSHVILKYKNKYFDCGGNVERSEMFQVITEEELVASITKGTCWNRSFDRSYIEKIEEKTGIDLSDIKADNK